MNSLVTTCLAVAGASWAMCAEPANSTASAISGMLSFDFTSQNSVVASQLKNCPDGHTTLKDVPIFYGLPGMTKESEDALARFEFWAAGCCTLGPNSPTNRVTCTTCGLGVDIDFRSWSADWRTPSRFSRPFSELFRSFPTPATNFVVVGPIFHQTVRAKRVQHERLTYTSREPKTELVKKVDAWFQSQGLKAFKQAKAAQVPDQKTELVTWDTGTFSVRLNHFEPGEITEIQVTNQREFIP